MHKSRRWLLASLGASAVAAVTPAEGKQEGEKNRKGTAGRLLPVPTDCESAYAKDVGLDSWLDPVPGNPADVRTALTGAVVHGWEYEYSGSIALPDFKINLLQSLEGAYGEIIDNGQTGSSWHMTVAQAFIIGQLTRFFWARQSKELKFRHLASAWAVFGRATSSCWCVNWVIGPKTGTKNAYVLPKVPPDTVQRQLDQPCALCN
jgi:hypothetical protein